MKRSGYFERSVCAFRLRGLHGRAFLVAKATCVFTFKFGLAAITLKQCGWLFNCIFWGPPPLTEPGRNAAKNMPTVRNSGAANIAYPVDLDSVAFLPEPVKGMPLRGGWVTCLWFRILEQPAPPRSVPACQPTIFSTRRFSSRALRLALARSLCAFFISAVGCGRLFSGMTRSEHLR